MNLSLLWRVDVTAHAICNQGLPKSILYGESTLITWKMTMKELRPILIISSISLDISWHVPSKALMIIVQGLIRDISTFRHLKVVIEQIFRADPLSVITLAAIMSSYLTMISMAKV